jgi:hypothetical protein
MSVDEYQKLCPYSEALEENWGKPPGNLNSNGQELLVRGRVLRDGRGAWGSYATMLSRFAALRDQGHSTAGPWSFKEPACFPSTL